MRTKANKNKLFIALFGPDGSGKTSAVVKLESLCVNNNISISRFHWRPYLLPSMSSFSGKPNDLDITRPHNRKQRGIILSVLLYTYIYLDFWIGYITDLKPLFKCKDIIVYERYFYDLIIDPKRYGLRSLKWFSIFLAHCLPKPKYVFVLTAEPEILFSRKRELPVDEISRQMKVMKKILPSICKVKIIDVKKNDPLMVANEILQTTFRNR